jgi:hypothetical protein
LLSLDALHALVTCSASSSALTRAEVIAWSADRVGRHGPAGLPGRPRHGGVAGLSAHGHSRGRVPADRIEEGPAPARVGDGIGPTARHAWRVASPGVVHWPGSEPDVTRRRLPLRVPAPGYQAAGTSRQRCACACRRAVLIPGGHMPPLLQLAAWRLTAGCSLQAAPGRFPA